MENVIQKKPFIKNIDFTGTIQGDEELADGLHFTIQYSLFKENKIIGEIIGTISDYENIRRVFYTGKHFYQIESKYNEGIIKIAY